MEEKARESARHKPVYESNKSIFRITANASVRERIIGFCTQNDVHAMMGVCRQWRSEWRDSTRQQLQAASGSNNQAPMAMNKQQFPWENTHAQGKMESILETPETRAKFIKFCESIYCDEYVHFYLDVDTYKRLPNDTLEQFHSAEKLYEKYIKQGAPAEIGAQAAMRQQVKEGLETHKANPKNAGKDRGRSLSQMNAPSASALAGASAAAHGPIESRVDLNFDASIQGRTRATTLTRHAEQSLSIALDTLQKRVLSMMRIDMMPKYLNSL